MDIDNMKLFSNDGLGTTHVIEHFLKHGFDDVAHTASD